MGLKPAKIIYFPMEIASRELDSRLLLAAMAASHGFEVVLGQKWLIERNIEYMTPGVYLSKTLTVRDARMLQRAKAAGYITAAIDEEIPGLIVHDKKFWWVSPAAVEATDAIFLPGSFNSSAFVDAFGLAPGRVRQAANPRWDLLRSELRPIFAEEAAELRRRHGDFILVNSNLGFTNSHKGNAQEIIQSLFNQGKADPNDTALMERFDNVQRMEASNRAMLIELLPALEQAFPGQKIILRPHPSENLDVWAEWTRGSRNLVVIREGSALPWIMASQILIHTNCTTGVEAIALDKPAICLMPTENPVNHYYLANDVNPVTRSVADAIAEIKRVLADPARCYSDGMAACFRDSMSFDPERLGAEAIIDDIVALGNERGWSEPSNAVSDWRAYSGYRWHQKDKNVRGILFPHASMGSVEARLEQYAKLLNLNIRLKVEGCGSKVILLSPRPLALGTRMRRAIGALQRA